MEVFIHVRQGLQDSATMPGNCKGQHRSKYVMLLVAFIGDMQYLRQCDGGNRSNAAVLCGALDAELQQQRDWYGGAWHKTTAELSLRTGIPGLPTLKHLPIEDATHKPSHIAYLLSTSASNTQSDALKSYVCNLVDGMHTCKASRR